MYEYYIVRIYDGNIDKKIVKIDKDFVYFDNNYISDYMILNEENIRVKRFNNPIFNNKKNFKYDINKITIEEYLPDIQLVSYLMDNLGKENKVKIRKK